ncbi:hypothetical protein M0805_005261 [Coniferiporia weirii]|nr:hypothetical protein M0805_005261 [Coniferiporia weirii]
MSSKRGRKRNDNLPPNRARDVQRAFRARRAAHLQSLEERVAELEEENDSLRAALNLPPANRPPLGRGPTGKDRAKPYNRSSTSQADSVAGEGSASPRTSTSSPHSVVQPLPSVSQQSGAAGDNSGGLWDHALTMPQHEEYASDREGIQPTVSTNAPPAASYAPEPHFRFDTGSPSRSRSSLSGALYPSPGASGYNHSTDRSTSSSNYSRDESFYSMATMTHGHNSSGTLRNLAQSSPPLHSHPHQMESGLGGGATHSPLAPHANYSPSSPAPPQMSLSMALGLRRSIPNPQHFPSYVDTFPPAPYPQRAQPALARQPPAHATSHPGVPLGLQSAPRHEYAGHEHPPDPSLRRTT